MLWTDFSFRGRSSISCQRAKQVAQLSQRDGAMHELLRFAKSRSEIFEPPFGGLRGKVGALSIPGWKARDRLSDKLECGPMPNLMVALPNIGGALCSTPKSLADAHY